MRVRILAVLGLGLILSFAITTCSQTTDTSGAEEILHELLAIPSSPVPPETTDNVDNPAYIATKSFCQLASTLRWNLSYLIQELIDNNITPSLRDGTWHWRRNHPDNESYIEFAASGTDTIHFEGTWNGPAYSQYALHNQIYGWISGEYETGEIERIDAIAVWENVVVGRRYASNIAGYSIAIIDSSAGGGFLTMFDLTFQTFNFEAHWDTLGHGATSGPQGKGNW